MKKIVIILVLLLNCSAMYSHWYNPGNTYYKLTTHRTGLSKMLSSDLPKNEVKGLHLVYCGTEIPYYLANNGDLIYCVPSSNSLNEYSDDFVVYLYYDDVDTALVLPFQEANVALDTITYGKQDIHLELDRIYFTGYDNYDYDNSRFEGWYWKIMKDYPGCGILDSARLVIDDLCLFANVDSLVNIAAYLTTPMSMGESSLFNSKRKVSSYINNDSVSVILFDTLVDNLAFKSNILGSKLFLGLNKFILLNHTIENSVNVAVDNINVSGYFKPHFYISNFYQSNSINVSTKDNSLLTIGGFADSILYLFDNVSNSFLIKENRPVTYIAINTLYDNDNPLTSIIVNGTSYKSDKNGIHIVILTSGNNNQIDTFYFQSYNQDVLKLLESVNDSSVVCIAINGKYDINDKMKVYLSSLGLNAINNYSGSGGDAYICSYKMGQIEFIEELNKDNKFCNKDISFYDGDKRWFAADVILFGNKDYSFVYSDEKNINIATITETNSTNLKDIESEDELIIIYHNDFAEKSIEYSNYRSSRGVKVKCVDVDDIYKEFGNGNKSPYPIKDFLRYAYNNRKEPPKYVLFIGDASTDPRQCETGSKAIDYIPSYGNPVSDYWFGIFDSQAHNSELMIGRIPCSNNRQLENYIEKVKLYESNSFNMWNKRFLFVNGGNTSEELKTIKESSNRISKKFFDAPIGGDTISFNKGVGGSTSEYKNDIIKALNNGAMLTTFHGHGSILDFDNWGWQVDNLNNIDKYGILATMSCNTGAFATNIVQNVVNEDFILSYATKGFIAALGATTTTTIGSNYYLQDNIVNALNIGYRRIGDIIKYAKRELNHISGDRFQKVMEYNFCILGDPMLEFKIDTLPDVYTLSSEVVITNENNDTNITNRNTEITIRFPIHNAGIIYEGCFNVTLESEGAICCSTRLCDIYKTQEVEFTIPLNTNLYELKITITLDIDNEIIENNKDNNIIIKTIRIMNKGLYPIEPLPNSVMNKNDLHFRFLKWQYISAERYDFYLFNVDSNVVYSSNNLNEIYYNMEYVDWTPKIDLLLDDGSYFVQVKQYSADSLVSEKTIPFILADTINRCDTCAELIFMSDNTGLYTTYYLRGDTAFFEVDLANISLRSTITDVIVDASQVGFIDTIDIIKPDSHIIFTIPMLTNNLETMNYISIKIIKDDLYDFNNTYIQVLNIEEDMIKPNLEIYFDNDLIDTNISKYISVSPNIKVILIDNSNLPVLASEPIRVQLNGFYLSKDNTEFYDLNSINNGKIKAELHIKPQLLTEKENLFKFIGVDGVGNQQIITYKLSVTINNDILSYFVSPNPSDYNDINIECELMRSEINGIMNIDIFDIFGKEVKKLSENINNRKNSIIWNQLDNNGNKVAQGTYYYILEIVGENWIKPVKGTIQIVK